MLESHFIFLLLPFADIQESMAPANLLTLSCLANSLIGSRLVHHNEILTNNNLISLFDFIVGGEDVSNQKPDPEGLYKITKALKIDKSECIYIGDNVVDAETAKNAAISFAAVLTGTTRREEIIHYNPVLILQKIDELINNDIWQ